MKDSYIRLFIAVSLAFISHTGFTQQLPLYSQYMMNKFLLNPAVAGSEGYTSFNITAREQWIGFKDSPKTHALSAQTRILRNSFVSRSSSIRRRGRSSSRSGKVGLGGYIFHDKTGLVSRTGLQLTYAYHIIIRKGQLSFGLSATTYQFKVDREKLRLYEQDDDLVNNFSNSIIIPDSDVGVYYSNPRMYFGLSASQLFQSSLKFGKQGYENYKLKRHYYFMGAYDFDVSDYLILEPNILVKATEVWTFQMDLGAKLFFFENYWAGLTYRTGGAMILMGGLKVDKFYFGYAFDYSFSSIMKHSFGTHEFMIAMKLGDSARRYRWLIRY